MTPARLGWRTHARLAVINLGNFGVWLGGCASLAVTFAWWAWCYQTSWAAALVVALSVFTTYLMHAQLKEQVPARRTTPPAAVAAPPDWEPQLVQLVAEVANELGLPRAPRLLLAPGFEAEALCSPEPTIVLGAALVDCADRSSLRALVGHECGHLHVSARAAELMERFIDSQAALPRARWQSRVAFWPFELWGYLAGHLLTRLRHVEERHADTCAVWIAPDVRLPDVLATLVARKVSFKLYRTAVLDLALADGLSPPWLEGYRTFRESPTARELERAADTPRTITFEQPHGHHSQRGAGPVDAPTLPSAHRAWDTTYPWTNRRRIERLIASGVSAQNLRPATFDEVGRLSQIPRYRRQVERSTALRGVTLAGLPDHAVALRERLAQPRPHAPEARAARAAVLSRPLCVALHDAGWELSYLPGHAMSFRRGEVSVTPEVVTRALVDDEALAETWLSVLASLGLADEPTVPILGPAAAEGAPGTDPPAAPAPAET